jgi:hypothetical protein
MHDDVFIVVLLQIAHWRTFSRDMAGQFLNSALLFWLNVYPKTFLRATLQEYPAGQFQCNTPLSCGR